MATQQQEIQQAQATLQMLEQLVRSRRATQQDVAQARERLARLQKPAPDRVVRSVVSLGVALAEPEREPIGVPVGQDEYLSLQAELSREADQLNRAMAERSNQLHLVPTTSTCPELTRPILELKEQIETIWDKKRYLERNRCLPDEPGDEPAAEENSPQKYELAYKKRRLIDLRWKLKEKLKNPAAKEGKKQAWEEELVRTNLEITEIDIKLGTL